MAHHHHHLGLAYADYFAAGGGGATVVVPEVEDADHHHIYGVHHQPAGAEAFVPAGIAADKSGLGGHHFVEHAHHATTLTSLSLHGPAAEAASSLAAVHQHQHHQLRQLQHQAWPQQQQQDAWHLVRGSRFLLPTQQLLQEFCGLPAETTAASNKPPTTKDPRNEDGGGGSSSAAAPVPARIQAMDAAELQRLKTKLYSMLDEVDRRYRRYREQMRAVAGSFEAVAGARAAAAYTRLASRTISRHFRTLRDGVARQVEAVRGALGEKDAAAGGVSRAAGVARGETTPRLRVLDQCLRQSRAYQTGALESQPWRPQRGLPERAVSILRAWLFEHFLHPSQTNSTRVGSGVPIDRVPRRDRACLSFFCSRRTKGSHQPLYLLRAPTACVLLHVCVQVSNWFINARVRLWKPMVEEMYVEEMKDDPAEEGGGCSNDPNNPTYTSEREGLGEMKPTRAQLVAHDAGSLASVVSIGSSRDQQQNSLNFGVMEHLGFGAYDGHGGGGSGVSLTLGLHQQHADPHGGVNVAFAGATSSSAHEFLFMAGGEQQQMVDVARGGVYAGGHHFGASVEGDTGVTTLKTNYHLLHDLAG
ncbi:hypothetical protein PR202_ga07683 [Eleusine coracana subsp. coracana]|uniref:POX domain-containing protein n=1 Tax=Eleusine coracana subsp. coracana TaxID=191504 RepID=A0AAV5BY38_ELECO|nr:hypothetical protein PR202_ga07683 [Eleusine coracana subsp. coracana]